ncbi:MAG: hypothetical protein LBF12_06905 [Christensenellaceae bacterium]|nr:hypothetical protein [Christensenellaceae bacterium]
MGSNEKNEKGMLLVKLIRYLTLVTEARNEPAKGKYPNGRIKRFFDTLRSNTSGMLFSNVASFLFIIPLLAVLLVFFSLGAERILYMLKSMNEPYILSSFGIGLSAGVNVGEIQSEMMVPYYYLILGIVATIPIFGIGFSGLLYVSSKMIWGESFITKKDKKLINDIPRMGVEFFRGVKLFWKESCLYFTVFGIILGGCASLIVLFVQNFYLDTLNVGHYFGLVLGIIIMIFSSMVFVNLIPLVATYKMKIRHKLRNAFVFTISFYFTSFLLVVMLLLPFGIMFTGNFGMVAVMAVLSLIGFSFYALMFVNYSDYLSENIIIPLLQHVQQEALKKQSMQNKKTPASKKPINDKQHLKYKRKN